MDCELHLKEGDFSKFTMLTVKLRYCCHYLYRVSLMSNCQFYYLFIFCNAGDQTQALMKARQVLYHQSMSPAQTVNLNRTANL
jgi:hypothetical protein